MSISSDDYYYDSEESDGEPVLTLREEVRRGDLESVRRALDSGANPNDRDDDHGEYTLLHWAAGMTDEDGRCEVKASRFGRKIRSRRRIVQLLLDRGAEAWRIWWQEDFTETRGVRPWDLTEDLESINMILSACVKQAIEAETKEREWSFKSILNAGLCAAALLDDVDSIARLISAGVDPNDDTCDYTPLSVAAGRGNIPAVRALVEKNGSDVDKDIDQNGCTALCVAASHNQEEMMLYLIENGACVFLEPERFSFFEEETARSILLEAMAAKVPNCFVNKDDWHRSRVEQYSFEIFITAGYMPGLHALVEVVRRYQQTP